MALKDFLIEHQSRIEVQARKTFQEQSASKVTEGELERGIPIFIDQLVDLFSRTEQNQDEEIGRVAAQYGARLFRLGFTVSEVVHGYGALCQVVTKLAGELDVAIQPAEFEVLNRSLDVAIAEAVTEYQRQREAELSQKDVDRLGTFVHELGNALATATISFDMIKMGTVGNAGLTASALNRSLIRMKNLIDRAVSEVRLKVEAAPMLERVRLGEVIDEIALALKPEVDRRGQKLEVEIDRDLELEADGQFLVSIVTNLVENAIKHTPIQGRIVVRGLVVDEHHLSIEVEDQCGGLPAGKPEDLFHPFVRRTQLHPGIGLGLAIVARAVKAHGGEVGVRNLPGRGCIFTVELPRLLPVQDRGPSHAA